MATVHPVRRIAGRSLTAMGATLFLGSIVACVFTRALILDLAGVIIFYLAGPVSRGRSKADYWAMVFMGYYYLMSGLMAASVMIPGFPQPQMGGRPIRLEDELWVLGIVAPIGVWATVNLCLLIAARWQKDSIKQPEPEPER
jgi:hypothetical protein